MKLRGIARGRFDLVRQSNLSLRNLDAVDLGGSADHAPFGFTLWCRDFDLNVVNDGDEIALRIDAELGGLRRASDAQHVGLRAGLAAVVNRFVISGEIDVFADLDRFGRRGAGRHVLDADHQVLNRTYVVALVQSGRRTGEERAEMDVGGHSGFEGRGQVRGLGRVGTELSRSAAPLEEAAHDNAVGPRPQGELLDKDIIHGHSVVAYKALGFAGRHCVRRSAWRSARVLLPGPRPGSAAGTEAARLP